MLDAPFDPCPAAVEAFHAANDSLRSSPDVHAETLTSEIGRQRGIEQFAVSLGAGSSEIIHRVLPALAGRGPVIILDPTYSEYAAVLALHDVSVVLIPLKPELGFELELDEAADPDPLPTLVIVVNPNNPTGVSISGRKLQDWVRNRWPNALLWVDEAYVDYAPHGTSLETIAAAYTDTFVLKSLSKAYALSGIRAAYLVSPCAFAESIRDRVPPWIIGTAAQAAAIAALQEGDYYSLMWKVTAARKETFADRLRTIGLVPHGRTIPAFLIPAPDGAAKWADRLASRGLVVRVPHGMGNVLGDSWIRIALPLPVAEGEVLRIIQEDQLPNSI